MTGSSLHENHPDHHIIGVALAVTLSGPADLRSQLLERKADKRWGEQADYQAYKARTATLFPRK